MRLRCGRRHYDLARKIRQTLAEYEELKDVIAMLGLEELSQEDRRTVRRARQLERFLTQPFFSTGQFTGKEGKAVAIETALDGCEQIVNDDFADTSERAFYMIGGIDEVSREGTSEHNKRGDSDGATPEHNEASSAESGARSDHQRGEGNSQD